MKVGTLREEGAMNRVHRRMLVTLAAAVAMSASGASRILLGDNSVVASSVTAPREAKML